MSAETERLSVVVTLPANSPLARASVGAALASLSFVRSVEVDGVSELQALREAVDDYMASRKQGGEEARAFQRLRSMSKDWSGGWDLRAKGRKPA